MLSIDGDMTAAEVRGARDTRPPRIVRAEATSLGRIDVWFNETVDRTTVEAAGSFRLELEDGGEVPIIRAAWDGQNGDRVTLSVGLEARSRYLLSAQGTIRDVAGSASGGAANALDPGDPMNRRAIAVGSSLTITLGASGYENLTVPVHDVSMVGPNLSTWEHDAVWLFPVNGGPGVNTGFVRFGWRDPFLEATKLESGDQIIAASVSLTAQFGDAHGIQIHRALQAWSDPATGGDYNQNPAGGPTWRDHAHPSGRWNIAGAGALGSSGEAASDYDGGFDLAGVVDAVAAAGSSNGAVSFSGERVTEAFRFWLENPSLDRGYALRLTPGAAGEMKFQRSESEQRAGGPVLTLTYTLPGATGGRSFQRGDCNADGEGIDLSDAVFILFYLFAGGAEPVCLAACDANGDGQSGGQVSDAISILEFLFLGGAAPPPPYPGCGSGLSPGDEALGCEAGTAGCR